MDKNHVTDYKTATHTSPQGVDHEVRRLLADGYLPFGSPYACDGTFCQAMVKYSSR